MRIPSLFCEVHDAHAMFTTAKTVDYPPSLEDGNPWRYVVVHVPDDDGSAHHAKVLSRRPV